MGTSGITRNEPGPGIGQRLYGEVKILKRIWEIVISRGWPLTVMLDLEEVFGNIFFSFQI